MFERAIAADSYYEDLETRMNYYQAYLDRFGEYGNPQLIRLAGQRIKDIREEMHLEPATSGEQ
jgi:isopentenyl diphosphate isomerase/L-lactate dehydrogenase-like FMN-dependent dehydrogenase